MDSQQWGKVRELVERAMELPEAERAAFLNDEVDDEQVLRDAERLLRYDRQASALFSVTSTMVWKAAEGEKLAGTRVGPYRVIEELGRGGMGVVYLGQRDDGVYQQQVAVKVLQEGVFTRALVARFLQERQILARLTHPGIARLLDGGVLEDGRPYFVLEYVDGVPIDQFCDEAGLDVGARLRLFLRVAEAVQAAHQQLVLHLDLKPANILITPDGTPRLLDFGIARILSEADRSVERSEPTTRLLTPRYASPEQASAGPLGVGSDVFSLATLLYRLLTGRLPYPIENLAPLEAARMISETPPMLPSAAAPPGLRSQLAGDLDVILLQALRKEPERRYPTVSAFAADIERHLASKPVRAHADSVGYRVSKFVRRNRAAVFAASLSVLILVGSGAAIVRSAVRARRAERVAVEESAVAQRRLQDVRGIAHSYIFELDPQLEQIPGTVAVRGVVLRNGLKYLEAMSRENVDQDEDLLRELGLGYLRVGEVQADPAMPSLNDRKAAWDSMTKGLALQRKLLAKHPGDLKQISMVARQLFSMEYLALTDGDIQKSYDYGKQSWATVQPLLQAGPGAPRFLHLNTDAWSMANLYAGNGELWNFADPASAVPWLDRMHDIVARFAAANPANAQSESVTAAYQREALSRAQVMEQLGRGDDARALYESALALAESQHAAIEDKQSLLIIRADYAEWALRRGDLRTVNRLAPGLVMDEGHGKPQDRNLRATIADFLCETSRIDLANGRIAAGTSKMARSAAMFEALYKEDTEDATNTAVMAHDFYELGVQAALRRDVRRRMFQRSSEITRTYFNQHPEALSAALLMGKDELGLAGLSRGADERHRHAAASQELFRRVLAAHPGNVEAAALLGQARTAM